MKLLEDPLVLTERPERVAQLDPKIDGLGERVPIFREVIQSTESLLEMRRRLPVGRTGEGLGPSLPEIGDGLAPCLTPDRVVGEPFDLLCETVGMQPLDGLHDLAMESAPSLLNEAPISDVVSQRVLERVLEVREKLRLIEELGSRKDAEAAAETLFGSVGDGLEEREGHVFADDRGGLEKPLVFGSEAIDARG